MEFRPRTWRLVLREVVPGVLALVFLVLAILGWGTPLVKLWAILLLFCIMRVSAVLWGYRPKPRDARRPWIPPASDIVAVDQHAVSQSGSDGLSRYIALADLDRPRSARRRPVDYLLGRQYLFSIGGDVICLRRWTFARTDVNRLLVLLGLDR